MKTIITILLCIINSVSFAQELKQYDGNWLKDSIDSFERAYVTKNGSENDLIASVVLISYTWGVLSAHQRNNMLFTFAAMDYEKSVKKGNVDSVNSSDAGKRLKVAIAFAPLRAVPADKISNQQIITILRKYLNSNPEKWSLSASELITIALQEAFSKKETNY